MACRPPWKLQLPRHSGGSRLRHSGASPPLGNGGTQAARRLACMGPNGLDTARSQGHLILNVFVVRIIVIQCTYLTCSESSRDYKTSN